MGSPGTVDATKNIILFDGVCNLCNGFVQFIIKRDKRIVFHFASLQSDFGQVQLKNYAVDTSQLRTIVLIRSNRVLQQSDAVLEIARNLPGGWPLLYGFKIIPRFIRDLIYRLIARNRYRMFGKKDACWIPTPELSQRFLG
jgi:predicted DCC family thiol-disulfide oxidoreductase YuxK